MKYNILFIIFMLPLFVAICNKITNGGCMIQCNHEDVELMEIYQYHKNVQKIERLDHDLNHLNFRTAFRLSRSFLGADGIFEWKGNLYTTLYKEEV